MPRPRSEKAADTESKVQAALDGLSAGTYKTPYQAAKTLGLSTSTLSQRMNRGKSRVEARESQQKLSKAEEKALDGWITRLTTTGHPARHDFVCDMAEEIRNQRIPNANNPRTNIPLGPSWVQLFLKRHPHLHTTMSRSIEAACIKDVTKDSIHEFFEKLEETIEEHQIMLENAYNMDVTGTTPNAQANCRFFNWNRSNCIRCG